MLHTEKCSIAKIIREENIICNQFKHLEQEHSTYLNTLIQDLGETIFVCAVTLIMRFLYRDQAGPVTSPCRKIREK